MDSIISRLARKDLPTYPLVKEVVKRLSQAVQGDNIALSLVDDLTDRALQLLSAEDFEEFQASVYAEAAPRPQAAYLADMFYESVEIVTSMGSEGSESRYLLAIPLVLTDVKPAWLTEIPENAAEPLITLLKEHHLIAKSARVTILPRLMGTFEAEALLPGDTYRLMNFLTANDPASALATVDSASYRTHFYDEGSFDSYAGQPGEAPASEAPFLSFGLLVLSVQVAEAEDPFPLATEVDYSQNLVAAEYFHLSEEEARDCLQNSRSSQIKLEGDREDLREVLDKVSQGLSSLLDVNAVTVHEEARGWAEGVLSSLLLYRSTQAAIRFQEIVKDFASEDDPGSICAGEIHGSQDGLQVSFYRTQDKLKLGVLDWYPLSSETLEDCADSLNGFLDAVGLEQLNDLEAETRLKTKRAPMEAGGSRTLH
jgi:hypothetical protein